MREKLKDPKFIIGAALAGGLVVYLAVNADRESDNPGLRPRQQTVAKGEKVYSHSGDTRPCGTVIKPFNYGAMESEIHSNHTYDRYSNQLGAHTQEIAGRSCDEYWVLRPNAAPTPYPAKTTAHAMGVATVNYVQL